MIAPALTTPRTRNPGQAAVEYARMGWHVLPIYSMVAGVCACGYPDCESPGKHPMIENGLKNATMDVAAIQEWYEKHPSSNVAVRTGRISGFIAIDIDPKNGGHSSLEDLIAKHGPLPDTVQAKTGSGGAHYLFAYPDFHAGNRANIWPGIDVKGDNGYIVVAPSKHKSGKHYEWVDGHAPDEIELAQLPSWLAELLQQSPARDANMDQRHVRQDPDDDQHLALIQAAQRYVIGIDGEAKGGRNRAAFSLAGHLAAFRIRGTDVGLSEDDVVGLVDAWNIKNDPPMDDRDIEQAVRSAFHNGTPREIKWVDMRGTAPAGDVNDDDGSEPADEKPQKKKKANIISAPTLMVRMAEREHELFHGTDNSDETYATLRVDGVVRTFRIDSSDYSRRLRHMFYQRFGNAPSDKIVTEAVKTLQGIALFDRPAIPVFTRFGYTADAIYIDLADDAGHAVKIAASGWQVVTETDVRFIRQPNMEPMPLPTEGDLRDLRRFIHTTDDNAWALCSSWAVSALMPKGPYPLLVLSGPQGSAKTTATRTLMKLIDPRKGGTRATPASNRDLAIAAQNAHLMTFDNLQRVQPWLSDGLCRLATGGGFATRKLYTNDEEAVFEACRPIVLNGIEAVATAPDLLDRSLLVELEPVDPDERMTEKEYWQAFDKAYPQLLAGLCDAVSMAMRNRDNVHHVDLPRMADAARWSISAAPALGLNPDAFMQAYSAQQRVADQMALEAAPIGEALARFIDHHELWEGTADELLRELRRFDTDGEHRYWPQSPTALGKQLTRLEPVLRRCGYAVSRERDSTRNRRRIIRLSTAVVEENLRNMKIIDAAGDTGADWRTGGAA